MPHETPEEVRKRYKDMMKNIPFSFVTNDFKSVHRTFENQVKLNEEIQYTAKLRDLQEKLGKHLEEGVCSCVPYSYEPTTCAIHGCGIDSNIYDTVKDMLDRFLDFIMINKDKLSE